MENKPENNSASNQNELDLGLNQAEPTTPKKSFEPNSSSFLNKFFGKKNAPQNNPFAERKEPTFGATASSHQTGNNATSGAFHQPSQAAEKSVEYTQETHEPAVNKEAQVEITVEKSDVEKSAVENGAEKAEELVAEAQKAAEQTTEQANSAKANLKNPENWAVMQKLPRKHRRLFIAIAGAVAVLGALVLLKPSSDTVEDFQANHNGNNMPIEFQSLDPNQPVENADMANTVQPAESTETAETTDKNPQTNQNNGTSETAAQNTAPTTGSTVSSGSASTVAPAVSNAQTVAANAQTAVENTQNTASAKPEVTADTNTAAEQAAREQQTKAAAEKAQQQQRLREQQAQAKARAEKLKAEQQAKAAQEKAKAEKLAAERARAKAALNGAPISEAKPVNSKPTAAATTSKAASAISKTLTVPASTSLFQVFRTNGLDIRDVNAMTKANGVGNALSSFKPGDKVQVSTNSEGRVTSMRLSDGSVFTRQADGSYKYSK